MSLARTSLRLGSALPSRCSCLIPARSFSSSPLAFAANSSASSTPTTSRGPYELPNGLLLKGTVISTGKMPYTSTVTVERKQTDHKTLKEFKAHTKYLIHDPEALCVVGDQVSIRNCRPVSKRKRFELVEVLKGARERVENMQAAQEVLEAKEASA